MNLGGHITVAAQVVNDDPGFWLGSALPDIGSIGRFRLLGSTSTPSVRRGIAFHHATDDAFHSHPWFVATQRSLQAALIGDGVHRGAARACAHVGPELLLDGQLLGDRTQLDTALAEITPRLTQLLTLVNIEHRTEWQTHLERVASVGIPTDYHNPDAVASRLHRILAGRRRLAFDLEQVPIVAEHLHRTKPDIDATAGPLVTALVEQLVGPALGGGLGQ